MDLQQYRNFFKQELSALYDEQETDSFFFIALEHFHQLKRIDLALNPKTAIDPVTQQKWAVLLEKLKIQQPIQYIIGATEFYGLPFLVNPSVLIPRPETEELVELIINGSKPAKGTIKILDIGTGSGCIAIALANNLPQAEVYAIDVSENALETAKQNAQNNGVSVRFIEKNILETEDLGQGFDIIVSNPPYVRILEKAEIKTNVLEFEPHLALFVEDDDALVFYRKIGQLAQKNLIQDGKLYFEINQYLGKQTVKLLEDLGFRDVVLKQDIYGNDRMVVCSK